MDFLYDYQLRAVEQMKNGCILNGGTGSGKSRTALYYYFVKICGGEIQTTYKKMKNPIDLLIITTARKRDSLEWEAELVPFLLSKDSQKNDPPVNVTIDSWNNIKKYTAVSGRFVIFDEDRVVGKGAWVKAFWKIVKNNQWIILSATPGDTWSDYIPVFVANGFYKNRTEFNDQHVVWKRFSNFPQIDRYVNTGRLLRLKKRILVPMDFERITIPHKENVLVNYDNEKYKYVWKERKDPETGEPIQNISGVCYWLRKIINSDQSRAEAVLRIAKVKRKVIIFYNFDYELEILKSLPYADGTQVAEMNGHKHQDIPVESNRWVYLVQYNAGAEAWNCTSTDTIIFFSQNYSYRIMTQAAGRIDRANTPYVDLYYYYLKSHAPIDLAIDRALRNKKKFNETKFFSKGE